MIPPRRTFGPIAGPPSQRVSVADGDHFVTRVAIGADAAERIARARIQDGLRRPADSHTASIEGAQLVWVPLWRVEVSIEGRRVGADERVVGVVPARRLLPVDPSARVALDAQELLPWIEAPRDTGIWIDPDVARDEAEHEVAARQRRGPGVLRRLNSAPEVRVVGAALVHLAVWLRRYLYEGEAASAGGDACHVAVHATNGEVVSERHPASWRALAGRLRRLGRRT